MNINRGIIFFVRVMGRGKNKFYSGAGRGAGHQHFFNLGRGGKEKKFAGVGRLVFSPRPTALISLIIKMKILIFYILTYFFEAFPLLKQI